MRHKRNLLLFSFVALFLILAVPIVFAQIAPGAVPAGQLPGGGAGVPVIAGKIVVLAGMVAALLQGFKKLIPAVNGPIAVVVSVVASLAAAYAAAAPGQVVSVDFFTTAIGTALGANGIHSFLSAGKAPG
jgi:hypothetical protein